MNATTEGTVYSMTYNCDPGSLVDSEALDESGSATGVGQEVFEAAYALELAKLPAFAGADVTVRFANGRSDVTSLQMRSGYGRDDEAAAAEQAARDAAETAFDFCCSTLSLAFTEGQADGAEMARESGSAVAGCDGWDGMAINAVGVRGLAKSFGLPEEIQQDDPLFLAAMAEYCRGCQAGADAQVAGAAATQTVTVKAGHATSRPHTVWVTPVGWEPDVDHLPAGAEFLDGAAWDSNGEVAGLAATFADLDDNDPEEGTEYEVELSDLFWLSSGDCRNLGGVKAAK